LVQRFAAIGLVTMWSGLAAAADGPVKMVVLGDSLSAGYGLPAGTAFPERLALALKAKGIDVAMTNAGVSGDTASGGLGRLDWSIPEETEAVILELGANDALRGLDPALTKNALDSTLAKLKERKIVVLLAGMLSPRNMGEEYARNFDAIYPALASKYGTVFYPFFLEGIAGDAKLNLPDGLHPTAAGVDVIVKNILPKVEELIAKVRAARGS
jgi:acyl-CoA thioesterase-1